MKLQDLKEMPAMVPQSVYPLDKQSIGALQSATQSSDKLKELSRDGDISIKINPERSNVLYVFVDDEAVGIMELTPSRVEVDVRAWQVSNVFVSPEYRNRMLGIMLYNFVLHRRGEAFAAGAAMTPSSRRIYTSLFKDPTVDVYALVGKDRERKDRERKELEIAPEGVTTGDSVMDQSAVFVAVAK